MKELIILFPMLQQLELPTWSAHFSDGQKVVFWVGCWLTLTQQLSMIIYFRSAWITKAYANSGSGSDQDTRLELHEVREVKKDLFQYETKTVFTAMMFTIPLLETGHVYPITVIAIIGTGAFGNTVLNLFEKAKRLFFGDTKNITSE